MHASYIATLLLAATAPVALAAPITQEHAVRQSGLPIDLNELLKGVLGSVGDIFSFNRRELTENDIGALALLSMLQSRDLDARQSGLPIDLNELLKGVLGSVGDIFSFNRRELTESDVGALALLSMLQSRDLDARAITKPITMDDLKAFFGSIFRKRELSDTDALVLLSMLQSRDLDARQSAKPITLDDLKAFFGSIFRRDLDSRQSGLPITLDDLKAFFGSIFRKRELSDTDALVLLSMLQSRDLDARQSAKPITLDDLKAFFGSIFRRELDSRQSGLPLKDSDIDALFGGILDSVKDIFSFNRRDLAQSTTGVKKLDVPGGMFQGRSIADLD